MFRSGPPPLISRSFALSCFLASGLIVTAAALPGRAMAATTVGSGKVQSEGREAVDFRAMSLSGSMKLIVRQSGKEAVEVRADDNVIPLIETLVEAGTLKVRWKRGENIRMRDDAVVTVDVKDIKAVSASGSGDVFVEPLKTAKFDLSLSGSSDAKLRSVAVDALSVNISGSGDISADGQAGTLSIHISGSGDVNTDRLQADQVSIAIAGSGDASVVANKSLQVSIAGSGEVVYSGQAAQVNKTIAGSGSVHKR